MAPAVVTNRHLEKHRCHQASEACDRRIAERSVWVEGVPPIRGTLPREHGLEAAGWSRGTRAWWGGLSLPRWIRMKARRTREEMG